MSGCSGACLAACAVGSWACGGWGGAVIVGVAGEAVIVGVAGSDWLWDLGCFFGVGQ